MPQKMAPGQRNYFDVCRHRMMDSLVARTFACVIIPVFGMHASCYTLTESDGRRTP